MNRRRKNRVSASCSCLQYLLQVCSFNQSHFEKRLKVFLFSSLGMAMDAFIKAGLMNFGPKIIEVRFQTDAATAAVKESV